MPRCRISAVRELTSETQVAADQGEGISKQSISTAKFPQKKYKSFVFSEDETEK